MSRRQLGVRFAGDFSHALDTLVHHVSYFSKRLTICRIIIILQSQGGVIQVSYQQEKPFAFCTQGMKLTLVGKQLMCELPDARFDQQQATYDHSHPSMQGLEEEHRTQCDAHAQKG
jgi:hypothetical protein